MQHKVNPHNLRTGLIRDWESRWHPESSIDCSRIIIDGSNFKNLSVSSNMMIYSVNKRDVKEIVKTMKKR